MKGLANTGIWLSLLGTSITELLTFAWKTFDDVECRTSPSMNKRSFLYCLGDWR